MNGKKVHQGATFPYSDLRQWMTAAEQVGELEFVEGADWNLEIGALTEVEATGPVSRAIVFDKIQNYPAGHRVLVGMNESLKRQCLTTNLPLDYGRMDFINAWRKRLDHPALIPPRVVPDGPLLQNVFEGKDIDLLSLPVPHWHDEDGGRYLGTADVTITRDPEEGWVNLGCYRVMVHDRDTLALYISPGKQARIHRQKYFDQGKPLPVAISFGHDPLLFLLAGKQVPWGSSEYDYAGGIKERPIDVIIGEHTGLPLPAHSEVAIEGEVLPDEQRKEGPFGEWTGYYASGERLEPVLRVSKLMYRDNPIITGSPPFRPLAGSDSGLIRSAFLWNYIEKAGVPDVKGVASYQGKFFTAISIRQRYPGHARQAGVIASQCRPGAYLGRFVVVVDDDIDVFDFNDVFWALCTRVEPIDDIELIRRCWSGPLDPVVPRASKGFSSRAIIDACRPYEWMNDFPHVSGASPRLKEHVSKKYRKTMT